MPRRPRLHRAGPRPSVDEDPAGARAAVRDAIQARQAAGIGHLPPEVDQAMRASGHFGPRVEVPPDADDLTRLLAFNGRRAG